MGTRGLMGVRIDGQDKLAYVHFDAYPGGLGATILEQLKDSTAGALEGVDGRDPLAEWRGLARALRLVNENTPPTHLEIDVLRPYADTSLGAKRLDDWYCLTRRLQGDLHETLLAGIMLDAGDFAADSLHCEWAYIVNLDADKLEAYRGFQKEPHERGRFAALPPRDEAGRKQMFGYAYYPIALVAEFDLNALPDEGHFVRTVDPPDPNDEEEEAADARD